MPRSLLARVALAGAVWICSGAIVHVDQVGSKAVQPSGIRARVPGFERLQAWFEIVRAHEIGEWDKSAKAVAAMDQDALAGIRDDIRMIRRLLELATAKRDTGVEMYGHTLRLTSLAPLMGLTDDELDLPADLKFLGDSDNPARKVISRIMIRAAMLHTRVAMEPVEDTPPAPGALPPGGAKYTVPIQPVHSAVRVQDGQQILIADRSMHWAVAREALDIVGPPSAGSPAVRAWYDATMEYLQSKRLYNALLPHLEHARALFPNDARVWLFSGVVSENFAAPRVQTAALDASSGVGRRGDMIQQAEKYLRRALELDPDLALAKLRLGRVLDQTPRRDEAAELLISAEAALSDPALRYAAALFLGHAEESRGRDEPAQAAYRRASNLFPDAQSPRLALASLAWRRGEQEDALTQLRVLATVSSPDITTDPWWRYDVCHVGDITVLFDRLNIAVLEALR